MEDLILDVLEPDVQSELFEKFKYSTTALKRIKIRDTNLPLYIDSEFYKKYNEAIGIVISTHVFSQSDYGLLYSCNQHDKIKFKIDPFRRKCLLEGLDDIGLTLAKEEKISNFEIQQRESQPWLYL